MRLARIATVAVLVIVGAVTRAPAQVPAGVGAPVPQGSPIPRIAPSPTLPTAPSLPPAPLPPAELPAAAVAVGSVAIEGATAYPLAKLQALAGNLTGAHVGLGDIEKARRAILNLYRGDGYPFVVVAARVDKNAVLHITIAEGYIADVKLSGDVGPVGTLVLRFLDHLTQARPINNVSIEYWLLLAQSIPGLQIQPILQASEREPGAFTLVAKLSRKLVSGSLVADNRAFPKAGTSEGLLTLGVNSLTSLGERTEASFYLAGPDGRELFGQASEQFFIGGSGLSVRLYGGAGDTTPCCDLAEIGYDGRTTVFGAQASYPLLLARSQQLYLLGGFDAIDLETLEQGARASADSLRILTAEADYSLSDNVLGDAFAAGSTAVLRLSRGISALGASNNGRTDAGRLNEKIDFTKLNGELTRDQTLLTLPSLPGAPRLSLFGLAAGQASGDILPTAEEFYLGGLRYTRGFYSGQITGDNALALTAELRVTSDLVLDVAGNSLEISPQFYAFYDWGETWQNQATDANHILRSYGLGVRSGITANVRVEVEAARRETRQIGGADVRPEPANSIYWRVVTNF